MYKILSERFGWMTSKKTLEDAISWAIYGVIKDRTDIMSLWYNGKKVFEADGKNYR